MHITSRENKSVITLVGLLPQDFTDQAGQPAAGRGVELNTAFDKFIDAGLEAQVISL